MNDLEEQRDWFWGKPVWVTLPGTIGDKHHKRSFAIGIAYLGVRAGFKWPIARVWLADTDKALDVFYRDCHGYPKRKK